MRRLALAAVTLFASMAVALPPVTTLPGATLSVPGGAYGFLSIPITSPASPTVTPNTTGVTNYTYAVASVSPSGIATVGAATTITNGNATANNTVTWGAQLGAIAYVVYGCKGGACTPTKYATINAPTTTVTDSGGPYSGAEPTIDQSGFLEGTGIYASAGAVPFIVEAQPTESGVYGSMWLGFAPGAITNGNYSLAWGTSNSFMQFNVPNGDNIYWSIATTISLQFNSTGLTVTNDLVEDKHIDAAGTAPAVGTFGACLGTTSATSVTGGDPAHIIAFTTGTTSLCAQGTALFTITLHAAYSTANYVVICSMQSTTGVVDSTSLYATPSAAGTYQVFNTLQVTPASSQAYTVQCMTMGAGAT